MFVISPAEMVQPSKLESAYRSSKIHSSSTLTKYPFRYDSQRITFVATKTDDISCREIIRSLKLRDNPTLREILSRLDPIEPPYKAALKEEAAIKKALQGKCFATRHINAPSDTHPAKLPAKNSSRRSDIRRPCARILKQ
jgi:hypothetical protein